ncbi:MAG: GNAT family N-acetyltransferase [Fimbriimonas sp.]|nr:GNAT family N-acetyltransferase [Fimbriimonas sp.]
MIILRTTDGVRYGIRQIRQEDRPYLVIGIQELSPITRYRRFLSARTTLTDSELDHLLSCDGWNHIAVVAASVDEDGRELDGIGVARFHRDPNNPSVGEVAIVVIDAWQGKGIGFTLLQELKRLCVNVGVEDWKATIMGENEAAQALFAKVGETVLVEADELHVTLHIEIGP